MCMYYSIIVYIVFDSISYRILYICICICIYDYLIYKDKHITLLTLLTLLTLYNNI